jgi:hypothetical protein
VKGRQGRLTDCAGVGLHSGVQVGEEVGDGAGAVALDDGAREGEAGEGEEGEVGETHGCGLDVKTKRDRSE